MVDLHDRLEWVATKPKSAPTERPVWERIMSLRKVLILLVLDAVLAVAIGYWAGRNEAPKEPEPSDAVQQMARDIIRRQNNGM